MKRVRIDSKGYFEREGKRLWPVGVNYVTASAGARFWQAWPEKEIRADLAAIRRLDLNTLRVFLSWEDIEPKPGRYDRVIEKRVRQFCRWCAECDLLVHPSLFTAWMSGAIIWPEWKGRRNLFEDPGMVRRSLAYARRCAQLFRGLDNLLAIDVGNEMSCLPDAHEARPDAVRDWCAALLKGLRDELPGVPIVPGNEQMMIFKDQGFRLTDDVGWDCLSAHGYPVPVWNECWMPGMRHPETQRRLPFYVKFLRAFGPVMLQEFGTIATFGVKEQRTYLHGMLERSWRAGANGFLFWCWKDVQAQVHPYTKGGIERTLGLADANGRVKPGLEPFVEFARELLSGTRQTPARDRRQMTLLLPGEWYARDNQRNPGNVPATQCEQYAGADSILDELEWDAVVARRLPANRSQPAIIAGAVLRDDEIAALVLEVRAGRRILWWSPSFYCWGNACRELVGAEIVDFLPDHPVEIRRRGRAWTLPGFPNQTMPVVRLLKGAVGEAFDEGGRPLLIRNKLGCGEIWTLLPTCATSAHSRDIEQRNFATELIQRFLVAN